MGIYGIDMGHRFTNSVNSGANGILREVDVNRAVGKELIAILRNAGHTVINCTDNNSELTGRTQKANAQRLDLFVSLHCNAFNGAAYGAETHVYPGCSKTIATNVNNSIVNTFGFTNRGVKESNFHVLRETIAPAILIEMFFIDSQKDCSVYNGQARKMAEAIAKGLGVSITSQPSNPQPSKPTNNLYRVRKTWTDSTGQKGAYSDLNNAKKCADSNPGYNVFDSNGNKVYPISTSVSSCDTELQRYTEYGKCTITATSGIKFRNKPCTHCGTVTGTYSYNESVNYDLVIITKKYIWVSWISNSTKERRYMPIKDKINNERWGNCV